MSRLNYYPQSTYINANDFVAVGAERFEGARAIQLIGETLVASTVTYTQCSSVGAVNAPSNSGEQLTIASDNVADIGIPILVEVLDQAFVARNEVVVLNGTTQVDIPGLNTRINLVLNIGTVRTLGQVSVFANAGATIVNGFLVADQKSANGLYTTPANKRTSIIELTTSMLRSTGSTSANLGIRFEFNTITPGGANGVRILGFTIGLEKSGTSSLQLNNSLPASVVGPIDSYLTCLASSADTAAYLYMSILEQDE